MPHKPKPVRKRSRGGPRPRSRRSSSFQDTGEPPVTAFVEPTLTRPTPDTLDDAGVTEQGDVDREPIDRRRDDAGPM